MKQFIVLATSLWFFLATDAQERYYTPSAYQVSAHDRKNQLSVSVARGNGYDANLSYSFLKNFCILVAYGENERYEKRYALFSNYRVQNNNVYKTIRVGYFKVLKESGLDRFETYIGYSRSKIDNYWSFLDYEPQHLNYVKVDYNSIFVGSDIVWQERWVEFSTSVRLNYYKFDSFSFYEAEPLSYYPTSSVDGMQGISLELISSTGFRYKAFKLLLQGGLSIPVLMPYATQTDTTPFNTGAPIFSHKEKLQRATLIFRLGLQFTTGFKRMQNER